MFLIIKFMANAISKIHSWLAGCKSQAQGLDLAGGL